jgi:hypothetical protein
MVKRYWADPVPALVSYLSTRGVLLATSREKSREIGVLWLVTVRISKSLESACVNRAMGIGKQGTATDTHL